MIYRFETANEYSKTMRIAFLGDSITEGCFELVKHKGQIEIVRDKNNGYPVLLKQKLEQEVCGLTVQIINAGVCGNTSTDGLLRVKRDILDQSQDLVVVCFGLNDVCKQNQDEYAMNLEQIFIILKHARLPVIYMTPNMLNSYIHEDTLEDFIVTAQACCQFQNDGTMDELMRRGKDCAVKQGILVCDCYESWKYLASRGVNTTELLCNFINHPVREMHPLFADMLCTIIRKCFLKS